MKTFTRLGGSLATVSDSCAAGGSARRTLGTGWYLLAITLEEHGVETKVDSVGRIVVPKALRDALGLTPGTTLDVSRYGAGLQLIPTGRTARLVEEDGVLVATGEGTIDDDVSAIIDASRR